MESAEPEPRHRHIPRFAKIIILAQATIILIFTVAMYQEYLNNAYLQQYVVTLLTSNIIADVSLSMITASVFALGTFTLLGSMGTAKKTNREFKILSETPGDGFDMQAMPVLEIAQQPKRATRKPRQRKRRANNDDIFRAMTRHTEPSDD